ncbi:MAG TPA: beta-xylosidase [Caulobacteraceae bacterium]|nr:beta-xylosidase [Caulobacteraceae bacterium]
MMKSLIGGAVAALALSATALAQGAAQDRPVSITVDLHHTVGPYKPIYAWFGYDEANYTTAPAGKALLAELHDLSPGPVHIRAHNLLTSGDGVPALKWSSTNVYTEDANGKPVYDFRILDGIFDAYKAAGISPMVELGFMPQDLASGSGPYHALYPARIEGTTVQSPPKDYGKWRELIRVVVAHLAQRYGAANVSQWYFEVWNEPDQGYWHGTPAEYFKFYDYTVAGVRAALPGAKVGGPATTGPSKASAGKFLADFLAHVAKDKSAATGGPIPMDFISFHAKGAPSIEAGHARMGLMKELKDTDLGFAAVARYPKFRKLPIIISEADPEGCAACSPERVPADIYRNSPIYPAYTAAAYKGMIDLEARRGVNLMAMLSWAFEFEDQPWFAQLRDLSTNGVDKPILNFFRMAALMKGERVAVTSTGQVPLDDILTHSVSGAADVDALATVSGRQAAVMVWNYHDDEAPAPPAPITLAIKGLPKGAARVLITHYRIDETHSNAYTAWQAMGSPAAPTAAQIATLKAKGGLEMLHSPRWADVKDGLLTLKTPLPRQSVSLVTVGW